LSSSAEAPEKERFLFSKMIKSPYTAESRGDAEIRKFLSNDLCL
jgi:hypothetical protein